MAKSDRYTFQSKMKRMVTDLRHKIHSGVYAKGEYLPSELALIELYGLSKNSVRQALEQLVGEGLIAKIPRVGTQVVFSPSLKRSIRFGIYPSLFAEAELTPILKEFHDRYPDVRVEIVDLPYESANSICNLMKLGIVDVLSVNMQDMLYFQDSGNTGLFLAQEKRESMYSFLNPPFQNEEGNLSVLPFVHSPVIMAYNKEHLRERRLFEPDSSWSWNDLHEMLRSLKRPNRYSLALQLYSLNRWPIFLLQQGKDFLNGDVTPEALSGLNWLRGIIHEEGMFPLALAQGELDAEKLFKEQKVSVILTTYYMLNQLKDAGFSYDVAPLPHFENGRTLLLSTGIGVNAVSKDKEMAQALADFLVSDGVQEYLRRHSYSLPTNRYITETVEVEISGKPSRLGLHREMSHLYTTYREVGLDMNDLVFFRENLKRYFSYLIGEEELLSALKSRMR
ncbi:extracellular solute-binding protein [Paenibacillus sp. DMB20]|uniref:extracellular solute-binding protein n=1 Tax=Paenibacillus sp. DMB20 TaxID=1642570 RepID=UPI0006274D0E|nr:extracellular solute-binding protein [Paenibacillus sp. DMB20]KKO54917.1 hypothetical protein XI25_04315 [Paenibacillus sp. DMB20]